MKYGLFRTLSAAGMAALEISAEPNQMKRRDCLACGTLVWYIIQNHDISALSRLW